MRWITPLLGTALLVLSGCILHPSPLSTVARVVVGAGHHCMPTCSHYQVKGVWYNSPGHRHQVGCGHQLVRGRWLVPPGHMKTPPGHLKTPSGLVKPPSPKGKSGTGNLFKGKGKKK